VYRARTGAGRAWAPPRAHLIVAYFFPLFFAEVENYRIPPPLARFQPNQEHPALPMMWQRGVLCQNGCRTGMGAAKSPSDCCVFFSLIFHRCGKLSFTSPPCSILTKPRAPSVSQDVESKRIAAERVLEGHGRGQRPCRTMPPLWQIKGIFAKVKIHSQLPPLLNFNPTKRTRRRP
jgi:hypothetical protein